MLVAVNDKIVVAVNDKIVIAVMRQKLRVNFLSAHAATKTCALSPQTSCAVLISDLQETL